MLKEYYRLAKPGIIYGNLLSTSAAFLFASQWQFSIALLELFLATAFGMAFVIGSACVFNNYLDRSIDGKMERTRNRALVTGKISGRNALIYGAALGLIGLALLTLFVNYLTAAIAFFGFLMYVFVYGYVKRSSHWGAVVGSIPGAVPIVVGYTAVTNQFDLAALTLFFILALWQLPHFYGIAMYRLKEYTAAGIPVLPAQLGMKNTKHITIFCIFAFVIATALLSVFGYAGYIYRIAVILLGLEWLIHAFRKKGDDSTWGRSIFFQSLIVLLVFCVVLAVSPILPPL